MIKCENEVLKFVILYMVKQYEIFFFLTHPYYNPFVGRLTITNYALYFEAMGVLSYEDAFKIDLSKDIDHHVKSGATGPWGAPLFDKAIIYESPEL